MPRHHPPGSQWHQPDKQRPLPLHAFRQGISEVALSEQPSMPLYMNTPDRLQAASMSAGGVLQSGPEKPRGQSHRPSSSLHVPCLVQPGAHLD